MNGEKNKDSKYFTGRECRLCSMKNMEMLYVFPACRVVRCRGCGLVQVLERPHKSELYNLYSKDYFQRGKYIKDRAIENACRRRVKWLQDNGVHNRARVLDAGCATGDFIAFAKAYFDMWGTDISEYAVSLARQQNPEVSGQISCQMIDDLQFPDEFFDAIVLWDVLEHLWDPLTTLSILTRFLRTGGIVAFSTPNIGAPIARLMEKHWSLMTVPEHLCFFDRNTINLLNTKVGLETIGWMTKGTWGNIGFLIYKAVRVVPIQLPVGVIEWARKSSLSKLVVYIPTGDIQFCAAKKIFPCKKVGR